MKAATKPAYVEDLLGVLETDYALNDIEMTRLLKAYAVAERAHEGQKRASGEAYITHCVAVAKILAEMHVSPDMIVAGLLHDTVEDTGLTIEDIRADFGDQVAQMVNGVTKLANLPRVSRADMHAGNETEAEEIEPTPDQISSRRREMANENLRKTLMAMSEDIRVVLIKLADRLHNMRTLHHTTPEKQKRIAQETLDIFAPLANRLGIWQIKWELEDLAFRYVNPEKYREIAAQLAGRRDFRERQMEQIIQRMEALLAGHNIQAEITGRPKHIYSIYKKMEQKNRAFEMLRDIRAVRLIVPDIPTCYSTLGLIHTTWRPIPHEFDDYIAAPKDNFYRSLHTAVSYDDNNPVEVQIRTPEMHESAEYGIAAHWRYKEGNTPVEETYEQRVTWLRKLMEWRKDVDDAQEFVEGMKSDVLQDRVYVFTPRGDIIDLPAGATPIDFAYHVHTDIGHRCRGAKVAGKLVPLDYALKTGDRVEILTSKTGGPSRDWLNPSLGLVKTQGARAKIRVWFKKQNKGQNVAQGRELIEHELQRLALSEINLDDLARELDFRSADDMYESIGRGDTPPAKIVRHLAGKIVAPEQVESIPISAPKSVAQSSDAVQVLGLKGILTVMGKCCHPMPGDEIVGYVTRGRGATIHRQDCSSVLNMSAKDRERLVRVDWGQAVRTYPVPVRITAFDRHGLMGDITNLLNSEGINIVDVRVHVDKEHVKADVADLRLVLEVKDIEQLSRILARIEKVPNVMDAQRVEKH